MIVTKRLTWRAILVEQELLALQKALEFTPGFKWGSCYSMLSRLMLVLFLLIIVLYVLTFTDFDYPFGILKYFLNSNGETGYDCYEKKA